MTDYCNYCWREADSKFHEHHQDDVPVCAYHYVKINTGGETPDRDIQKANRDAKQFGYGSWAELKKEYEDEEQLYGKISASEVISVINHAVRPTDDPNEPDELDLPPKDVKDAIRKKVNRP